MRLAWLRKVPWVRLVLVAAPVVALSWRTHNYHRRPPEEVARAAWLEDGIRFHFERRGLAAMRKSIGEVHFDRPELRAVFAWLEERSGVPFDVRWSKLAFARVSPESVLWARIGGMNLDHAIEHVCGEVGAYQGDVAFHWIDGKVVIARPQDFEADRVTRVYPADDLVEYYRTWVRPTLTEHGFPFDEDANKWVERMVPMNVAGAVVRCTSGKLYVTAARWRWPSVYDSLALLRSQPGKAYFGW